MPRRAWLAGSVVSTWKVSIEILELLNFKPLGVKVIPILCETRLAGRRMQICKSHNQVTKMQAQATVSAKGKVTLPASMRAKLGIVPGALVYFELRGCELVLTRELPMSSYCGMLKGYDLGDIEPVKEFDRTFE